MKQTIALLSILIVSAVAALAQNGTYMVTNLKYFKQQAAYRIVDEAIVPEMTMDYKINLGENGMPSIIAEMPEDGTYYPMTDESYASLRTMLINMMESSLSLTAPVIPHSVVITDSSIAILNTQGDTLQHFAVVKTRQNGEKTHFVTVDGKRFDMKHLTEYSRNNLYRLTIGDDYYELSRND